MRFLLLTIPSGAILLWLIIHEIPRIRPLNGWPKTVFVLTAGPIFIILMVINIRFSVSLSPDTMGTLAARGRASFGRRGAALLGLLSSCALPSLGLWIWYRLLLTQVNFPASKYPLLSEPERLSPVNIEIRKVDTPVGQVVLFRPKELSKSSGYFYVTLNGDVVAALGAEEYTRIHLAQQVNEIGCYARSSTDSFNNEYKFNCITCSPTNPNTPLNLIISSDIFSGSRIREINVLRAEKYAAKYSYVEQGPRLADLAAAD